MAGKLMTIVRAGVENDLTNADMIANNPDLNAQSIRVIAAKFRRLRRLEVGFSIRSGRPAEIPANLMEALATEANRRRGVTGANDLLRKLVGRIVHDNLYDAILDEE